MPRKKSPRVWVIRPLATNQSQEVSNQDGIRIATFTGQAYTGRQPVSFDGLQ